MKKVILFLLTIILIGGNVEGLTFISDSKQLCILSTDGWEQCINGTDSTWVAFQNDYYLTLKNRELNKSRGELFNLLDDSNKSDKKYTVILIFGVLAFSVVLIMIFNTLFLMKK